jgi:competence protein ComEC
VGSIIIFFRPVYNWVYLPNKLLDHTWKLCAVTLSAQLLTLPVTIYHFHQFPLLFLLTNLVAVPLSSIILSGEIVLCAISFLVPAAGILGIFLSELIQLMNSWVGYFAKLSFSVWNGLSISPAQAFLLFIFIMAFSLWLVEKQRCLLCLSLVVLLICTAIHSYSLNKAESQLKLIVYRILHRIRHSGRKELKAFYFGNTSIIITDENGISLPGSGKINTDLLIITRKNQMPVRDLLKAVSCRIVILDSSVPASQAAKWKKELLVYNIPCHDVMKNGAFVMTVQTLPLPAYNYPVH